MSKIFDLPSEILSNIFIGLSYIDLQQTKRVCKIFQYILEDAYFWRRKISLDFLSPNIEEYTEKEYLKLETLSGTCQIGSEQFLPIQTCLKNVMQKNVINRPDHPSPENEKLLKYFCIVGLATSKQDINLIFLIAAIHGYIGILNHSEYDNVDWDVLNTSMYYAGLRGHENVIKWGLKRHASVMNVEYICHGCHSDLRKKIIKWEHQYMKKSFLYRFKEWLIHKL